jgi:methyl-accepting chemotaxis protein
MTPMLELITTALAGIDMAGFGKRLAEAFIGGTAAMEGFTASLGALKVGEFSLAWEMAWASIKLQAKQTANEIYRNMVAAFSATAEFLIEVLGPDSDVFKMLAAGFDVVGYGLAASIGAAIKPILSVIPYIGEEMAASIEKSIQANERGVEDAKGRMGILSHYIKGQFVMAGQAFPESFKSAYEATQPLLNVQEDMQEVNRLAGEINKTAAGLTWNMMSEVKDLPQLTWNMKDHMKEGAGAMEKAAKTVKETLSLSEEIVKRIKEANGKDAVDKGGKLEKAAGDAIAEGDFRKAERIAEKLKGKEQDAAIREAFGGDRKFGKSVRDMAKEQGIDTSRKSNRDLKKELQDRIEKRKDEMPEGKRGRDDRDPGGKGGGEDPATALQTVVEAIRVIVAKIEPKLPTAALGV